MSNSVPTPMANWLRSLPQQCVGALYATIKDPITQIGIEYRVEVWGQVCDGRDHKDIVHLMLYNRFPFHGKGFTYVSWRAEPDNPETNTYPRTGAVKDPKPYSGVARE